MITLQTPRLTLVPCCLADVADFMALEGDAKVMRFLHGGPVDRQKVRPDDVTFLMPQGNEPYIWTARRRCDAGFVGWFCLYPETGLLAELGYRLTRANWGHGLATEGSTALVDWGFVEAGYDRIFACTMSVNVGSRRVMEKLGMAHVGTDFPQFGDPIAGAEEGDVRYELQRNDWIGRMPR